MPFALEGRHALERNPVSQRHVRRGDVDPELHPQRPPLGELPLELAGGQHVDSVLGELRDSHVRLATLHSPDLAFASPQRSRGAAKRRRIRKLRLLVLTVALSALAFSSFTFGLVTAVASEAPKCDPAHQRHQVNTRIYDSTGHKILAVLRGSENRVLVDYDDISPLMKQAMIAVEDRRYFEHRGVDMRAIGRALWADIRKQGVVQGGSTITQQFIKNSCSDNSRTIGRKVREATLAWGLEQRWSKKKILTAYLNTVYFGNGAYGVDQAARTYFGHRAKKMTLWEVALLAGSRPTRAGTTRSRTPRREAAPPDRAPHMLALGTIDAEQFRRADREPLPKKITRPDTAGPAATSRTTSPSSSSTATRPAASSAAASSSTRRSTSSSRSSATARSPAGSRTTTARPPRSSQSTRGTAPSRR